MDADHSGKVSYVEFKDMVRSDVNGLALKPRHLPEATLKKLWVALDNDGNGYVTAKVAYPTFPTPADGTTLTTATNA